MGGEPEQPVSREVVAAMAPAQAGAPSRWFVDFWVQDVDDALAQTEARGGAVVVAAFESPPGRSAVVADPAGVTFSITQAMGLQ